MAITSCVVIHDNNVSRLFTTKVVAVFTHFFDNVTVTNSSHCLVNTFTVKCLVETKV